MTIHQVRADRKRSRSLRNRRNFIAQVEALERREMLFVYPIQWDNASVSITDPCSCGSDSASSSSIDTSTGNVVISAPTARGLGDFAPEYSTTEFRSVVQSVDSVFGSTVPTMIQVNSTYYSTTGVGAGQPFRVGDLLDTTSLAAGRYPFTLSITEHHTSPPNVSYNATGYSLVAGPSNALLSPGWHIPGIDKLTVSTAGACGRAAVTN